MISPRDILYETNSYCNSQLPIDPIKISHHFGIQVLSASKAQWDCAVDLHDKPVIYISNELSHTQKRFAIAMMLGYYFLYGEKKNAFRYRFESKSDIQRISLSLFAVGLLTDEYLVRSYYYVMRGQVTDEYLASKFDVSLEFMKARIKMIYGDNI